MSDTTAVYLGFASIYAYGLAVAAAALAGCVLAVVTAKKRGLGDAMLIACTAALPSALVLGRALFCIFKYADVANGVFSPLDLLSGGYMMCGVIGGVFLGLLVAAKIAKVSFARLCDCASPALGVSIAAVRAAGAFAAFDRGNPVKNAALCRYPFAVPGDTEGVWLTAVFRFEAAAALLGAAAALIILCKIYRKNTFPEGSACLSLLLVLGLAQSFLESLRGDSVFLPGLAFVRVSQLAGALTTLAVLTVLFVRASRRGGRRVPLICYLLCIAQLGTAFWMEKSLGGSNTAVNYTVMAVCLAAAGALGFCMLSMGKYTDSGEI